MVSVIFRGGDRPNRLPPGSAPGFDVTAHVNNFIILDKAVTRRYSITAGGKTCYTLKSLHYTLLMLAFPTSRRCR